MITAPTAPKHWPHQIAALRFVHTHRGSLLWVPMRAGKTRIAIDYIQNTTPGPTLIVCPHKVIPVWADQFKQYLADPEGFTITTLGDQCVRGRANEIKYMGERPGRQVFIVNYDVIAEPPLCAELLKVQWSCLFFDEVHRLQAAAGKQSRFAAKLSKQARKVVGLSGTPGNPLGNPKQQTMRDAGILDLYGVMRTLAPGTFAHSNAQYKARFGIWNQFTPFPKIEGYQNHTAFDAALAGVCFHVTEADLAYTMPEAIEQVRPVTLPYPVQKVYDDLEEYLTADYGEDSVTAGNALVKQLRLQQLTSGFLQPDTGEKEQLMHTEKFNATREIIEDIAPEERILVFCHFVPEMDTLTDHLKTTGRKVYHIRGGVDTSAQWKATPGAVLIVQDQAGGEGLDLSMTNYCIYNSLPYSLRLFQQSFKRPQLPNKKHPIAYYYIVATGTIDEDIQAALAAKAEVVDSVQQRLRTRRSTNHDS